MVAVEDLGWASGLKQQATYLQPPAPLPNPADSGNSEDDGLALLPKHTVVRIRGNARTRQSLVGQRAIVRRAVGLGGWHWLVLPSGEEVKLQRNALEILERPTGNEQEMSEEEDEEQRRRQQQQQEAAARGYIYEPAEPHGEDRPRPRRATSAVQQLQPRGYGEEYSSGGGGGGGIAAALAAAQHQQRTRPPSTRGIASSQPRINFNKLQTAALKRYGTVYCLPEAGQQAATREQLLGAVAEHFAAQQVDEGEVIACFLSAVKRHRMGMQR